MHEQEDAARLDLLDPRAKKYVVGSGYEKESKPFLGYMIRLSIGVDSLVSSFRWTIRIGAAEDYLSNSDFVHSIAHSLGLCSRLHGLLQEGERRQYFSPEDVFSTDPEQAAWRRIKDGCTLHSDMKWIRDKYVAHLDNDFVEELVEHLASGGQMNTPWLIIGESDRWITSSFGWAKAPLVARLKLIDPESNQSFVELIAGEITALFNLTTAVLSHLTNSRDWSFLGSENT